jgi:hypothetical protein
MKVLLAFNEDGFESLPGELLKLAIGVRYEFRLAIDHDPLGTACHQIRWKAVSGQIEIDTDRKDELNHRIDLLPYLLDCNPGRIIVA